MCPFSHPISPICHSLTVPGRVLAVASSFLCALHFAPKWFRWENRGRPRMTSEPLGEPKLDKYAEPTIFS